MTSVMSKAVFQFSILEKYHVLPRTVSLSCSVHICHSGRGTMEQVSSYSVRINEYSHVFDKTVKVYRSAVDFFGVSANSG